MSPNHPCTLCHQCRKNLTRCPPLQQEEWQRIASYLAPRDLASLSQVSTTCFRAATSPEIFRARYLEMAGIEEPPFSIKDNLSWAAIYRRRCAVRYPPHQYDELMAFGGPVRIVASLGDAVVFHDTCRRTIVGHPRRWELAIGELTVDPVNLRESSIELRNGLFGLIGCATHMGRASEEIVSLTRIHAESGQIVAVEPLPSGGNPLCKPIESTRLAALGGVEGEYILYWLDEDNIAIVSLSDLSLVTRICLGPGELLVFGASHALGVSSICGIAKTILLADDHLVKVEVRGLPDGEMLAQFGCTVFGPVAHIHTSEDRKTYAIKGDVDLAVVTLKSSVFVQYNDHLEWEINDVECNLEVEVKGNGSLIAPRPRTDFLKTPSEVTQSVSHSVFYFLSQELGSRRTEEIEIYDGGELVHCDFQMNVWHRMSAHGGLVLSKRMAPREDDVFSLWEVDLKTHTSGFKVCNRRRFALWYNYHFADFAFVGDHVAVGVGEDGQIVTLHFGAFCSKGRRSEWKLAECTRPFK